PPNPTEGGYCDSVRTPVESTKPPKKASGRRPDPRGSPITPFSASQLDVPATLALHPVLRILEFLPHHRRAPTGTQDRDHDVHLGLHRAAVLVDLGGHQLVAEEVHRLIARLQKILEFHGLTSFGVEEPLVDGRPF